ncbi:hypothetical protein OS493_037791 [Desmophyllum pertusum]|uniref:Uncharacterized protein n=1 Tax=Desmophyllum pertusum TaxID=174260 RepID=A0A9W9Y728_9CNID|nr:hypothetical protein OS493_037791 [Desmophyllum pertusum]
MKETKGSETFTFSWNPCTPFSDGNCKDVLLCQYNSAGSGYAIAKKVNSFTENDDGSITLTYNGIVDGSHTRMAVFKLVCDANQNPGRFSQFVEEDGTGGLLEYTTTFSSKCVCDEGCPDNPGGNTGETEGLEPM